MGKRKAEEADDPEGTSSEKTRKARKKERAVKRLDVFGKTIPFRKAPNKQVQERMERALPGSGHRLFILRRRANLSASDSENLVAEFDVLGSTGNVYTVKIAQHPHCTCPDFEKRGGPCKHILFTYIRFLRLSTENPIVWQKALLTSEIKEVLQGIHSSRPLDDVFAPDNVVSAYEHLQQGQEPDTPDGTTKQRPVDGQDCPICMDGMTLTSTKPQDRLVFCKMCGNSLHAECFDKWSKTRGADITCVYCRTPWPSQSTTTGGSGAYQNLAGFSAAHADTPSLQDLYGERAQWIRRRQ